MGARSWKKIQKTKKMKKKKKCKKKKGANPLDFATGVVGVTVGLEAVKLVARA